ncbi:MAG: iron-containing alcohol dehydrogenase [Ilumatobacteraceae bacterium]
MTVPYSIGRAPAIEVGVVAADRLPSLVGGRGAVLVVDAALRDGFAAAVERALAETADVQVSEVPPGEPTADSVDAVGEVVRRHPAAVVVGIGGGSVLDTAKQAAMVAGGRASIEHYALCANPFPERRTIVAVPTTSGTGSEVTRTCIFTDRSGRKVWTWADGMLPDVVLLDPRATVSLPPAVTATTGLDAFVHAIEAASGRRRNALVTAPAVQAMRLTLTHLPQAVRTGTDLLARQGMQEAALLAGLAIDAAGTGMAHSIGHALGALARMPHGLAVSVGLRAALAWNVEGAQAAYADIAAGLGVTADALPAIFERLAAEVGVHRVARSFGPLALTPAELAEVMVAEENQPMFANNARPAGNAERDLLAERTLRLWSDYLDATP